MTKKLVAFTPASSFTAYPAGKKTEFTAGVESIPVPEDFAQLMRDKGRIEKGTQLREPKKDEAE